MTGFDDLRLAADEVQHALDVLRNLDPSAPGVAVGMILGHGIICNVDWDFSGLIAAGLVMHVSQSEEGRAQIAFIPNSFVRA